MTTMKDGVGDDPFADDEHDGSAPEMEGGSNAPKADTGQQTSTQAEIPYVLSRDTVKEDRPNEAVAFLRDEFDELEDEVHERVADEMGMRQKDVPLTDVREAFVALADRHPDELADILLGWGHEHRRD